MLTLLVRVTCLIFRFKKLENVFLSMLSTCEILLGHSEDACGFRLGTVSGLTILAMLEIIKFVFTLDVFKKSSSINPEDCKVVWLVHMRFSFVNGYCRKVQCLMCFGCVLVEERVGFVSASNQTVPPLKAPRIDLIPSINRVLECSFPTVRQS